MMENIRLLIFDWEGTLMSSSRELFPGVKEMLLEFKNKYLLAVATNRYRHSLNRLIESFELQNVFDASRCADESGSKPDPTMLREILDELDVKADESVMIGDSESDMAMARKIKMPRIAIGISPYVDALLKYEPYAVVVNVTDISPLF